MSNFADELNDIVQIGRGTVGQILGNPYAVFRLSATSNQSVIAGTPAIPTYLAKFQRAKQRAVEAATFELDLYEVKGDNRALVFGDVLVGLSTSDMATYVFAQAREFEPTLAVRCEKIASIYRPRDNPSAPKGTTTPTPGAPHIGGTFESSDISSREKLTLTNGIYFFDDPGATRVPATVPLGMQMTARAGGPRPDSLSSTNPSARYIAYLPPLGTPINQNDVIAIDDDHEFVVTSAYEMQTSFVGTVLVLEEMD